jgi:tRNA modification GTPase
MRPTYFALSSGAPPAAIAIVRISGPAARAALQRLGGSADPRPRHATLTDLIDPRDGAPLDRALILFFPAAASVTGEDLVELHLHGGRAVVNAALAALGKIDGLTSAPAGAFTRQAFDNGRMDLTQVEGLADLLAAETEVQRRHAIRQAEGHLSRRAEQWREQLLAAAARVAATLDFSDEGDVVDEHLLDEARSSMRAVTHDMEQLLAVPTTERLKDGIRVVLSGPPNSGKSSLINYLAGRDIAIVTDVPGTTRDLLEVPLAIDGLSFVLIDSAGLRETSDIVEQQGVARARAAVCNADIVLAMGESVSQAGTAVMISSKADLYDQPGGWRNGVLHVSAFDGRGIEDLLAVLVERAKLLVPPTEDFALSSSRQRTCIASAKAALLSGIDLNDGILVDEHIRAALADLSSLVGKTGVEDMLGSLFVRFCIGK